MRTMLLAAGLGTRLRPITERLAKPAIPFLNVPLIFWSLTFLKELEPDRVVINLHHRPDTIRSLEAGFQAGGHEVRFTHEEKAPLGSGGALWFAKQELEDSETILIANADEVILPVNPQTMIRMREQHESSGAIATLLTMRHSEAGGKFGGVWTDDRHSVMGFGKDRTAFPEATQTLHYVGVLLVSRRIFKFLPEGESNLLYDAIAKAIASGERVKAFCEDLCWFETGSPKDFLAASRDVLEILSPLRVPPEASTLSCAIAQDVLKRHAPEDTRLWESQTGARLLSSSYRSGSISESQICDTLTKGNGFAVIGDGALIQASVFNSVVLPGAEVGSAPRRDALIAMP